MKKEFIQELANNIMFKKLTTTMSFLKKEELSDRDLKDLISGLKRDGIYQALKETGQDPEELMQVALTAFDAGVKKMRTRFEAHLKTVAEKLKEENK